MDDAERHYSCAFFLLDDSDPELKPDPELALLLLVQAIAISEGNIQSAKADKARLNAKAGLFAYCTTLAVESSKQGFEELAEHSKRRVVNLLKNHPTVAGARPPLSESDSRVFQGIRVRD